METQKILTILILTLSVLLGFSILAYLNKRKRIRGPAGPGVGLPEPTHGEVIYAYYSEEASSAIAEIFTVPDGIYSVEIEAWGGNGSHGDGVGVDQPPGGIGGYSKRIFPVIPGTELHVYVGMGGSFTEKKDRGFLGGRGGKIIPGDYFGDRGDVRGGYGGRSHVHSDVYISSGGGGAASDVRLNGNDLSQRIIVAGGGGGGGGSIEIGRPLHFLGRKGGEGGGLSGADGGSEHSSGHFPKGGTQTESGDGFPIAHGSSPSAVGGGGGGGGYFGGSHGASLFITYELGELENHGGGGGSGYVGGGGITLRHGEVGYKQKDGGDGKSTHHGQIIIKY
jgi:hypothetical protein